MLMISWDSTDLKDTLEAAFDESANWGDGKMNIKTQVMRKSRKNEVEHATIDHQGVTLTADFLGVIVDRDLIELD